ncbi:MAG: lysophospholipid acyltransferase family protein [Gammaproteobacteria bacterium]|nr:lysophospholipid acyltransferase family protein [Gammaproteobacteria bacterium]MCI0590359.1 lysophospholipid acyltransferase family protein [Gammaproteobacteria bacterium]
MAAARLQLSRLRRLKAAMIAALGFWFIALLGRTLRWRVEGIDHFESILQSGHQPIFAFYHGRILCGTYYWRQRGIVVITSEHFDGEWIARIIQRFGYGTVRGSTSRGARRAIIQLKRAMADGLPTAFTVDGPRGPARHVQPGLVWLASTTGQPILPFHIEAARYWTVGSWDRTQIPKPFSHVAIAIGAPLEVPTDATEGMREEKRQELERVLRALSERASQMLKACVAGESPSGQDTSIALSTSVPEGPACPRSREH